MFSLILGIIIALAALIFAFQNNDLIEVGFLVWQINSSVALVIIAGILAGFLVGFLLMTGMLIKSSNKVRALKKRVERAERDNNSIIYETEGLGEEGETLISKKNHLDAE